jgi:hypothetical protein
LQDLFVVKSRQRVILATRDVDERRYPAATYSPFVVCTSAYLLILRFGASLLELLRATSPPADPLDETGLVLQTRDLRAFSIDYSCKAKQKE